MQPSNTVLITGANRGIGLEYVKQYAALGNRVIATARTVTADDALSRLAASNPLVECYSLDVGNADAIQDLATQLGGQCIDILISNAGVYPESRWQNTLAAAWQQAFQINTLATYYLAEAFLPHLQKAQPGKLIAMSSKMGSIADNSSGSSYIYRTSKAALNMLVKSLALDLQAQGVLVAALHPGWVRTDMGGPQGLIDAETSVQGLRKVIAQLSAESSGSFMAYNGLSIPW